MAARPPVAKPLLPPGERFRSAIEEAKEGGIAPSAMLLQLTHTDAAKLRRDQSIPVHDLSFADGAMRYFIDTFDWADRAGIEVFWFAAFDEAWKVGAEGDVGAYWGLWDKDAKPKLA